MVIMGGEILIFFLNFMKIIQNKVFVVEEIESTLLSSKSYFQYSIVTNDITCHYISKKESQASPMFELENLNL